MRRDAADYRAHLEAVASVVEDGDRVLSESFRGGGLFLTAFGAILGLVGLGLMVFAPDVLHGGADQIVVAAALAAGLGLVAYGLVLLRRGERAFLVLRPGELAVPGLDRPIPWGDVADLDMTLDNRRMITRLLLPPEAVFPQRTAGVGRVKLDNKRRIVTVSAGLPRGMKPQAFADLIDSYRHAAAARRQLAAEQDVRPSMAAAAA